jgi:hypothetical protein
MTTYKSLYEVTDTNALIDVNPAYATFFDNLYNKQQNVFHKSSFNYLEVINNSNSDIIIALDNLATRQRRLFGKSIIVIKAEENIFFNTVQIINTDGVNQITAGDITATARIMLEVA